MLTSGGVDCWGDNPPANSVTAPSIRHYSSSVPVAMLGVGGSGTLNEAVQVLDKRDAAIVPSGPRAGLTAGASSAGPTWRGDNNATARCRWR